jgi:hypothetical protein
MTIAARDWLSLSNLLDTVLSLPREARPSWVEGLDAEQEPLKPVLRELLAREDLAETGSFLATLPKIGAPQAWQASEKYDAPESPARRHRVMR